MLLKDEVADGIHEGADAFRLANSRPRPEVPKYTNEGFLLKIFDDIGRQIAGAEL